MPPKKRSNSTKVVINTHGRLLSSKINIPDNIRLVLFTISGYKMYDITDSLLKGLKTRPEVFLKTNQGTAITKTGMEFQKQIREDLKIMYNFMNINHPKSSMLRLISIETGDEIKDVLLDFSDLVSYYNPGIYIYDSNNSSWKLYMPTILLCNNYPLYNGSKDKYINIKNHKNRNTTRVTTLSDVLNQLSKMAKDSHSLYEVYLVACLSTSNKSPNIREQNKYFLNRQRKATLAYNKTLLEYNRSGINMRKTRSLHYDLNFYNPVKYFNYNYDELPQKDREEILPQFNIRNKTAWEEKKSNQTFQNNYKKSHSQFTGGKKKLIHIGPRGGKFYYRIIKGKKVKKYIK